MNKLIVITGVSGSGKTTLANNLGSKYNLDVLSLDDFKVDVYEKYGFDNEFERVNLKKLAEAMFTAELIKLMRENKDVIVEYPFRTDWQEVFESVTTNYEYMLVVISCKSLSFDEVWGRRVRRNNSDNRHLSLKADKYIKDKIYEHYSRETYDYKELQKEYYINDYYTGITGDLNILDSDVNDSFMQMLAKL